MKPLKIILEGFEGIYAAFGRDKIELDLRSIPASAEIVALVAPNGGGKTTILENMHPYRVMPSRSTTLGPGGFSYWTQVRTPSAKKDFLWEHGGKMYHSVLTFKSTGKTQKADCYLYEVAPVTGEWRPVVLPDGTVSDGKAVTYDHCVDTIIGPPEAFFTAHFSAQTRKTIASYQTGEIKSILASVLNLQNYRELAAGAAQVGKLLRQQLAGINEELAEAREHSRNAALLSEELERINAAIQASDESVQAAQGRADRAREALAAMLAKRDAQAKDAEEVRFLTEQIAAVTAKAASGKISVTAQFDQQIQMLQAEIQNASTAISTGQKEMESYEAERRRLEGVFNDKSAIEQAGVRLVEHRAELDRLDGEIEVHRVTLAAASAVRTEMTSLTAKHARLESEGKSKVIVIQKLAETAAVIDQVPCKGSDMQQTCPLMLQANTASREVPNQKAAQDAIREEYVSIGRRLKELQAKVAQFDDIEAATRDIQVKRKAVVNLIESDTRLAARAPLIADAEARLPALALSITNQQQIIASASDRLLKAQDALAKIGVEKVNAIAAIEQSRVKEAQVLEDRLAKLEKPVTDSAIASMQAVVANANATVIDLQGRGRAHTEHKVSVLGKLEAVRALAARSDQVTQQAVRLHEEIAAWKVIEKGLGNDGCVALSIDDAGPGIASLCNGLLADCFNGRFRVRLDTQRQTQAGDTRETFDVMVFDEHRGSEKSLGNMSGGEEVLVNECLTRAVALYASQISSSQCQTLFTDETDGALDPATKRTFMQMKRAVLKQGGYDREYFITHTPELWEMADHKIMIAEL